MVVFDCFKISQKVIDVAWIAIRGSFARYVTQYFHNFHLTFIVVSGSIKIFQTMMDGAKVVYGFYKISRTVLVIGKVFSRGANLSL